MREVAGSNNILVIPKTYELVCAAASFTVCLFFVCFVWFNAIFQHNIGYTWRPVLMVEEEPGQPRERTTDPREATGKLSHITTFAES